MIPTRILIDEAEGITGYGCVPCCASDASVIPVDKGDSVYISAESIEALLSSHPTDGQPRSLADALRELLEGK